MPSYQTCIILGTQAKPPSIIISDKIILHKVEHTDKWLFINVSWEEPALPYGDIVMYELRIGREALEPNQEPNFLDSSYLTMIEVCT